MENREKDTFQEISDRQQRIKKEMLKKNIYFVCWLVGEKLEDQEILVIAERISMYQAYAQMFQEQAEKLLSDMREWLKEEKKRHKESMKDIQKAELIAKRAMKIAEDEKERADRLQKAINEPNPN